jgi:hypothetical protein
VGKQREVRDLSTSTRRWEAPDGSLWEIVMQWAEVGGRAECVGMELRSYRRDYLSGKMWPLPRSDGPQPISSEVWRRVPMSIIDDGRAGHADFLDVVARTERPRHPESLEEIRAVRKLFTEPGGRGRKLVGENGHVLSAVQALTEVAAIYREAWRAGLNPTQAVAEALSLSRSAAAKRVRRARDAGLLPETTRGRPTAASEEG